jgi:hypothetical protein
MISIINPVMIATFNLFALITQVIVVFLFYPFGTDAFMVHRIPPNKWFISGDGRNLQQRRYSEKLHVSVLGDDKDEGESLESVEQELIRCLRSFNPFDKFKIPLLRERKQQEKERKEQEKEQAKLERKLVNYSIGGDNPDSESNSMYITRNIFEQWVIDNKHLYKLCNWRKIISFEEIEDEGDYVLVKKSFGKNFEFFAETEANVQTRDCVAAIRSGQVLIPPFNEEGIIVEIDFTISFKKQLYTSWNINSPIKPDAIMIHGSKWLILECKHNFDNALLKEFDKKCDFIKEYAEEKWVHKNYPVPTDIVRVACSVGDFNDDSAINISSEMIKIVRDGQSYKILDKGDLTRG